MRTAEGPSVFVRIRSGLGGFGHWALGIGRGEPRSHRDTEGGFLTKGTKNTEWMHYGAAKGGVPRLRYFQDIFV